MARKFWFTAWVLAIALVLSVAVYVVYAGTIAGSWIAQAWIEGGASSWTTLSGTTEELSTDVDATTDGAIFYHVMVEINYDASPTDQVKIKVRAGHDTTDYDDTPVLEFQGDKTIDPQQISFIVRDLAHFKVCFQQTGTTDSHDVRAAVRGCKYSY